MYNMDLKISLLKKRLARALIETVFHVSLIDGVDHYVPLAEFDPLCNATLSVNTVCPTSLIVLILSSLLCSLESLTFRGHHSLNVFPKAQYQKAITGCLLSANFSMFNLLFDPTYRQQVDMQSIYQHMPVSFNNGGTFRTTAILELHVEVN